MPKLSTTLVFANIGAGPAKAITNGTKVYMDIQELKGTDDSGNPVWERLMLLRDIDYKTAKSVLDTDSGICRLPEDISQIDRIFRMGGELDFQVSNIKGFITTNY